MAEAAQHADDADDQIPAEPVVDEGETEVAVETQQDERLGAGREPAERETEAEHRPSRTAQRRKALQARARRLESENQELRAQFEQLARGQQEIVQRLSGSEGASIEAQIQDVERNLQTANAVLAKARNSTAPTADQDFVEALNIRDQLVDARRNLGMAKQFREQQRQPERQAQQPQVATAKDRLQARFIANNSDWFDPRLSNRESKLAERLSAVLDAEGELDNNTPEYWAELDRRVHAHPQLAHLFDEDAGADDEDERDESAAERRATNGNGANGHSAAPARAAGGPRLTVAGRERPLKRGEVKVPRELKENMQQAGQWDDPKVRARVIARYQETLRAQRQ